VKLVVFYIFYLLQALRILCTKRLSYLLLLYVKRRKVGVEVETHTASRFDIESSLHLDDNNVMLNSVQAIALYFHYIIMIKLDMVISGTTYDK